MSQRIEAGIHRGRAVADSQQYGQTSKGNDQIVLNLELLDLNETVSTFLVFSDAAAPWSIKRLRACGWEGDDLSNLTGIDKNEVDVEVKYEEYNGEMKMKVQIVAGGTVTLENQFDDRSKKAFAAKFRDLAKATASKSSPVARRATAKPAESFGGNQATGTDDDIPF